MEKSDKNNVKLPVYYKIAVDLASRIAVGEYLQGEKVYARSTIAVRYGVSSETARKAIAVLADLDIVKIEKGSGIIIESLENAKAFIQQLNETNTLHSDKKDIFDTIEQQRQSLVTLEHQLKQIIDNYERFRDINPFIPFSIKIDSGMSHLNKSLEKTNFWHNTTATIIAIKRGETITISPGPYATFHADDIVYFIGDEKAYEKVMNFMYQQNKILP